MLGSDTDRVHQQLDSLLDNEDAVIVLLDGSRAITYAHGFGLSPCQLELLMFEIENAVRKVGGPPLRERRNARNHDREHEQKRLRRMLAERADHGKAA
jgi:hypothetical protein